MMNDANNRIVPQLVMKRIELFSLPPVEVLPGYKLRVFKTGDEAIWESIIYESFGNRKDFKKDIESNVYFLPERVFFICRDDVPVATATAWYRSKWGEETGYLHMVGNLQAHRGKNLGLQVSLAALHKMADEGRKSVILQTDDFRLAAIKTYLKLGFKPMLVDENQVERWRTILASFGEYSI